MDKALQWFYDRNGKTFYSMTQRNGQVVNGKAGYDCSSAVYYALTSAGLLPSGKMGNTDSLFGDLERNGWVQLGPNAQGNYDTKKGDVFIWGRRGASGGAAGHTGIFMNANDVIHCAAYSNGITTTNYDQLAGWNGWPVQTFYRYVGANSNGSTSGNPEDQDLDVGSVIKLDKTYTVNDVQLIAGIWQVKTDVLCPVGFTWEDNGIPAEPLVEVDSDGYATSDQNLDAGSLYKIPGKFTVLDLGPYEGRWFALIEWNGLKFWVDVESATEIKASATGTPAPSQRHLPQPEQPKPVEPPKEEPKPVEPEEEQPVKEEPKPQEPPKEDKMAFTQEQQKILAAQQSEVLNANTDFTPVIGDKAKTIAYFITDSGITVSTLLFTVLGLLHYVDAVVALGINAAIVTALLGLKQTFRLSAKKQ